MAPLGDVSNKYHVNLLLDAQYASTRSLGNRGSCENTMHNLRAQGKRHIDLWVDGNLYPLDPATQKNPPFRTMHDLVRYVGDGMDGLLGYCNRLNHFQSATLQACEFRRAQLEQLACSANSTIVAMQRTIEDLEMQKKELLEKSIAFDKERQDLQESIKQQVESNQSLQRSLQIAKDRVQKLKDTPLGKKERKRKLQSLDSLAPKGGAKKRRILATRLVSKISHEFFILFIHVSYF